MQRFRHVALADGTLVQWSPDTGHHQAIGTVGPTPDSTKLVASRDGSVVVASSFESVGAWHQGEPIELPVGQGTAAVSPTGRTLGIVHDLDGQSVLTYGRLDNGHFTLSERYLLPNEPHDVAIPNDREIVTLSSVARRFDLETRSVVATVTPSDHPRSDRDPQAPYLSDFGDRIYDQHSIRDTAGKGLSITPFGPPAGENPTRQSSRYSTTYLSTDGLLFAEATDQGVLNIYGMGEGAGRPVDPTVALEGSIRYEAASIPSQDWAFTADGPVVTRWNLRGTTTPTVVDEVALDFSILQCDVCLPPVPQVNGDGSAFGASSNFFETYIVQRSGRTETIPDHSFLAWKATETYFASSATSIELRRIGTTAAEKEWPIPYEINAGYPLPERGHWVPDAGVLRFHTAKHLCQLAPTSRSLMCSEDSVAEISPDGSRVARPTGSGMEVTSVLDRTPILHESGSIYFTGDGGVAISAFGEGRHQLLPREAGPELNVSSTSLSRIPVSPNGAYFLNRDKRGEVTIYSRSTGTEILKLPVNEAALEDSGAEFSGDSSTIVLLTHVPDGWVSSAVFVDLNPATWRDQICTSVRRPLAVGEWNLITGSAPPPDQPLACA